jgi:Fe-S cluster assembly protein SufD
MTQDLASRIAAEHASASQHVPEAWSRSPRRRRAIEALTTRGLPSARDENWKYANLRALERVRFAPPAAPAPAQAIAPQLPPRLEGYERHVFIDGAYVAELSDRAVSSPRVQLRRLQPELPALAERSDEALGADGRFALLNDAFATDGVLLSIAGGKSACVDLVFVASADGKAAASYPRALVQLDPGAELDLVERHVSIGSEASFVNASLTVQVGSGSQLRHYRVQQLAAQAVWVDTLAAVLDAGAIYRLHAIGLGALTARSTLHVRLAGERAAVTLAVASVASARQTHDAYALVEHAVPHARTEQTFRGIAAGRSRVAFNGKIVVRESAHGTDSRQSLRGLLAGPEAEIDVRPQLEIYTDDVRCSHGATAGKLDEAMLFYLLSRGIEPNVAQQLLKWAFLEDVVSTIGVPELRRQVEQSLAGQMQEGEALKELL